MVSIQKWSVFLFLIYSQVSSQYQDGRNAGLKYLGVSTKESRWAKRDTSSSRKIHYFLSQNSAAWYTADDDCKSNLGEDAQLLTIRTKEDLEEVTKFLANSDDTGTFYWTGGMYDPERKKFVFRGGGTLPEWLTWEKGHPQTRTTITRVTLEATGVKGDGLRFRTESQTASFRYICELRSGALDKELICGVRNDLMILMDSSKNVEPYDFPRVQEFTRKFALEWNQIPGGRVGVVAYANFGVPLVHLNDSMDKVELIESVQDSAYLFGNAEVGLGLEKALEEFRAFGRYEVPKNILILTGGSSESKAKTEEEVLKAKTQGIRVFVLGIGDKVDKAEMLMMSQNKENNVFHMENLEDLPSMAQVLADRICS